MLIILNLWLLVTFRYLINGFSLHIVYILIHELLIYNIWQWISILKMYFKKELAYLQQERLLVRPEAAWLGWWMRGNLVFLYLRPTSQTAKRRMGATRCRLAWTTSHRVLVSEGSSHPPGPTLPTRCLQRKPLSDSSACSSTGFHVSPYTGSA